MAHDTRRWGLHVHDGRRRYSGVDGLHVIVRQWMATRVLLKGARERGGGVKVRETVRTDDALPRNRMPGQTEMQDSADIKRRDESRPNDARQRGEPRKISSGVMK